MSSNPRNRTTPTSSAVPTEELEAMLTRLRLPAIRERLDGLLKEAARREMNLREALAWLCTAEIARKDQLRSLLADQKSGCRHCDSPLEDQGYGGRRNPIVPAAEREIEATGHPEGSSCRDGINALNSGKMGGIFKHRRNVFSLKIRVVGKYVRCTHPS